jgi:hypothetical protein
MIEDKGLTTLLKTDVVWDTSSEKRMKTQQFEMQLQIIAKYPSQKR